MAAVEVSLQCSGAVAGAVDERCEQVLTGMVGEVGPGAGGDPLAAMVRAAGWEWTGGVDRYPARSGDEPGRGRPEQVVFCPGCWSREVGDGLDGTTWRR